MAKDTIRVYRKGDEWIAKKDSTTRPSARGFTQKEVYLKAREIALNQGLTITVYYATGGIKAVINPRNREEESNCFLTTACVKYFHLPDNCYELETLRKFRDTHLLKSQEGQSLILEYYSVAPPLVRKLENDHRKKELFEKIFIEIKLAINAIENGRYEVATSIYIAAVHSLIFYFRKN